MFDFAPILNMALTQEARFYVLFLGLVSGATVVYLYVQSRSWGDKAYGLIALFIIIVIAVVMIFHRGLHVAFF